MRTVASRAIVFQTPGFSIGNMMFSWILSKSSEE